MFKYTEKKLAKDIGRVAESIDPALRYTYSPADREVRITSSKSEAFGPYTVFLGNLILKISALPRKERHPVIAAFVRELLAPKRLSPDELMNTLALRVRTDFEIKIRNRHLEIRGGHAIPTVVSRRGELSVEIVSNQAESVSIVKPEDLAKIGVTEGEAMRIASARLRRATGESQWREIERSIWKSSYEDDFDFARLVAAEGDEKFPFAGQPIVFSPSHSICLATDSASPDVLTRMVDLGVESASNHRPFSQLLWTRGGRGEWRVWQPDRASEAWDAARLQQVRETVTRYVESKELFERLLGEETFVAGYKVIRNEHGLTSVCAYTFDVPSYIPGTEFVAIVDPGRPERESVVGRVTWQEFEQCLGPTALERVEDFEPAWFRMMSPLDDSAKDRLRQMAQSID